MVTPHRAPAETQRSGFGGKRRSKEAERGLPDRAGQAVRTLLRRHGQGTENQIKQPAKVPGSAERSGERGNRGRGHSLTTTVWLKANKCGGRLRSKDLSGAPGRRPAHVVGTSQRTLLRFLLDRARPVFFDAIKENGGRISRSAASAENRSSRKQQSRTT